MFGFFVVGDRPEGHPTDCSKMLVSCKDGLGRTGTVAMILTRLLQRYYKTRDSKTLNDSLKDLRSQREGLVSSAKQLKFVEKYDETG